jgi:hypothetical protein
MIPVLELAKTFHALDRAATVVGGEEYYETLNYIPTNYFTKL